MPELPEVEIVARGLRRYRGKRISSFEIFDKKVWFESQLAPAYLVSRKIAEVSRRGKYLIFELDDSTALVAHLRMTGKFLDHDSPALPEAIREVVGNKKGKGLQVRCRFRFDEEGLIFYDTRRFGTLTLIRSTEEFFKKKKLAPDIVNDFETASKHFLAKVKTVKKAIKAALLDQSLVAGAGNIYADEALFELKIDPRKPANKVKDPFMLLNTLKAVMERSLELGGTTVYNYVNSSGEIGNFAERLRVYGKRECPNCKRKINTIQLGGRTTHFCAFCQR